MTSGNLIPATILKRKAVFYARQSTQAQVQLNLESQRRQYELVGVARRWGFRKVEVIDEDLGRTASGAVERPGFERLVDDLCTGHVGAVLCLEAMAAFARAMAIQAGQRVGGGAQGASRRLYWMERVRTEPGISRRQRLWQSRRRQVGPRRSRVAPGSSLLWSMRAKTGCYVCRTRPRLSGISLRAATS